MASYDYNGDAKAIGTVVRPQKVPVDKSVARTVASLLNDVFPQGPVPHKANDKEVVEWIHIDQLERLGRVSDPRCPILVSFGYANGVQVWAIESHGEAWEVYSVRQGPVRAFRLLPVPEEVFGSADAFAAQRPLAAVCEGSPSGGLTLWTVNFVSLRDGAKVYSVKFRNAVEDIVCSQRVVVLTFADRIVVYDACSLKERNVIHASFPPQVVSPNPVALGKRWLAFAESKIHDVFHSKGGRAFDGIPSYTASMINAAKSLSQGISQLSEAVAGSLAGAKRTSSTSSYSLQSEEKREGIVSIVDLETIGDSEINLEKTPYNRPGVIAHFLAHSSSPIAALAFNPDGALILTVSQTGQNFHLFRIHPHPAGSCLTFVQHLYTLHRGDTNATLQDICFSLDSRWVAVTSMRATTHVFPITPYGGQVTHRTHASPRVVNKVSRFMKSAGLEDLDTGSASSSPPRPLPFVPNGASQLRASEGGSPRSPNFQCTRGPLLVQAIAQIKHTVPPKAAPTGSSNAKSSATQENIRVSACFATRRSKVAQDAIGDSLFIATSNGTLQEYTMHIGTTAEVDRVADDSDFAVTVNAQIQWLLNRHLNHPEFVPPFAENHPLLNSPVLGAVSRTDSQRNHKYADNGSAYKTGRLVNCSSESEPWLSQVEIATHSGPARRLWMGPQFHFTPLTTPNCQPIFNFAGIPQAEIQRTGSDCDLTNLKLTNIRLRSAATPIPIANAQYSAMIEAGSGSFDRVAFPVNLPRDSNSTDDLRLSEIADAMADLIGCGDLTDGPSMRRRGLEDDSPEDLSAASSNTDSISVSGKFLSSNLNQQMQTSPDVTRVFHPTGPDLA